MSALGDKRYSKLYKAMRWRGRLRPQVLLKMTRKTCIYLKRLSIASSSTTKPVSPVTNTGRLLLAIDGNFSQPAVGQLGDVCPTIRATFQVVPAYGSE